jgi:hypothetical protein
MTATSVPSGGGVMPPQHSFTGVVIGKGPKPGPAPPSAPPASREAQRLAVAILEVLAGVCTPSDAAAALRVSLPRYYLWEQRALAGMVSACEPRSAGRGSNPQRRVASLEKEIARLRQDCSRQQALVRVTQRTIGLGPPPPPKVAPKSGGKASANGTAKARRKRRPVVRALKAAAALEAATVAEGTAADSPSGAVTEVLQRSAEGSPPQLAVVVQAAPAASRP